VATTRVTKRLRYSVRALLASVFAALIVVLPGAHAHADPTVAEIEAQISKVWAQAEPLIEEYNGVHEDYRKNKAKQVELEKKLAPLRLQIDLAHVRLGALAAEIYKHQGANTFSAIISAGSPDVLADQLSFLDIAAREQQRQISGVTDLMDKYNVQKAPLDVLVAGLAKQDADLAAKKKTIEARLSELQKLRSKAYGTTGATGGYRPWPCPSKYEPTNGYKVAKFACGQAGKPYVWAASGPNSYDCSGLTLRAWAQVGVYLPHKALYQSQSIPEVSRANLQLGDLVFYFSPIHHVGVYVGNNKIMHAPTFGDNVRMADMDAAGPINSAMPFGRPRP
jgi:cell wall-associated NlpC family hydrolase